MPSEYLLDMTDPRACMTALEVKFSDGMSSRPFLCLSFSCSMMSKSSGSTSERGAFMLLSHGVASSLSSGNAELELCAAAIFGTALESTAPLLRTEARRLAPLLKATDGHGCLLRSCAWSL